MKDTGILLTEYRNQDACNQARADSEETVLLSPMLCDLSEFPPIDVFYGTKEVMIAYLEDFKAVCEKYEVPLSVHIGEGMRHCWGAMDFVPEAKAVRRECFAALR